MSIRSRRSLPSRYRSRDYWPLFSLPLLIFLVLPLGALILRSSPRQIWLNLQQPAVFQAVLVSLQTSIMATGLTVLLGTPVALLIARRTFRGKTVLDTLLDLPTVLPPAVAGVALLIAFGRRGLIGQPLADLGLSVAFTQTAVIMAQLFVASPLYLRAAILGFAGVEMELVQAAALDGAGEWAIFRHVILPLSRSALLSGALVTWARALGEFGATIIFAGNFPGRTQTMPLAIYLGFELDLDIALTLSVILLSLSFLVLAGVRLLLPAPAE